VDTTGWVDYFNNVANPHTAWLEHNVYRERIGITDLILCEILQGARDGLRFGQMKQHLTSLPVICGSREISIAAAGNYRFLRDKGITVRKLADTLIATTCIENGYSLLHHDRDFDGFEKYLGLKVIHPTE
jgi:predicted nucleic acid-binding protein